MNWEIINEFQEKYKTAKEKEAALKKMNDEEIYRLINASTNIYGKMFYSKFLKNKKEKN